MSYTRNTDRIETVIWDFNGTLLDDLELTVETVNIVLSEHGAPPVDSCTHRTAFRFPIIDYYRDLGLRTSPEAFARLSERYHDLYMERVQECALYDGVSDVLRSVRDRGIRQFVLSALNQTMLDECISSLGLSQFFSGVYGLSDILGRSKVERGSELINDFSIDTRRVLYIGDTAHDVEVASALGFHPVAVSWGHQHGYLFDSATFPVVDHPSEIISCLN